MSGLERVVGVLKDYEKELEYKVLDADIAWQKAKVMLEAVTHARYAVEREIEAIERSAAKATANKP